MQGQANSVYQRNASHLMTVGTGESLDILGKDCLQTQENIGMWMDYILTDSPGSVDDPILEYNDHSQFVYVATDGSSSVICSRIFSIPDVSPPWVYSTEKIKGLCFVSL